MSQSLLSRSLLALALLAAPSAAQEPPQAGAAPKAEVQGESKGVDVTFLANAGFLLESGRYSVLIDSFLREPTGAYGALPTEAYKALVNAEAPYDGLTVVLVSHGHPDHVQARGLEKYLTNNRLAQLMTSPQVARAVKDEARDLAAIQRQITPVPVVRGSANKVVQEDMSIEFFELTHAGGKPNEGIVNLGHLIQMGGLELLHVGDADPTLDNFAPYGLAGRGIDVAFVPYWFFGTTAAAEVLRGQIKARIVVACHVPASEADKLGELLKAQFPEVILFGQSLEKRRFLPAGVPDPAGQVGGG